MQFRTPSLLTALAVILSLTGAPAAADRLQPGARVWLHAHNCYPEKGQWGDRLQRALALRTSDVAIEQDVAWFVDPATGRGRIVVSHDAKPDGTEPTLEAHFFDRVRPIIEAALRDNRKDTWPVMVLHLDFKTNEPAHHQAVWDLLGKYESWLTTAARVADEKQVTPFTPGPLLVLTEAGQNQLDSFYTRIPVGGRLRLFGTVPPATFPAASTPEERAAAAVAATPEVLIPTGATNYRRWTNFPWAVVELGGQNKAGPWTADDAQRLRSIVSRAHELGLWVRFYTLNGHSAAESKGWTASYNFGSAAAGRERMAAARDAGVEFIASDQYEELGAVLSQAQAPASATATVGKPPAPQATRPFGTLRELATMQQRWLRQRLDTFLPALLRKHGIDMWVVPMREYTEDPVFSAITAPETFAARRRTIYVFFDTCAAAGSPPTPACVQRIALGGSTQGGVFEARRSTKAAASNIGRGQQAELWGDEQWQALKSLIEERRPRVIGINRSTVFAFSDGLTSGELQGMSAALGDTWTARFKNAEGLPLELIASRLPEEEELFRRMQELVWSMTQTMFSSAVITPGATRTSDLVWWWRQRVNDYGLDTWFQPSIEVQRKGATADQLGDDPIIQHGDVLHCDVGITVARLNTDTQHNAYVLRPGETDAPAGLKRALANANALQDIVLEEIRPGRTGNEILATSRERMKSKAINGTVYSHPIGLHGHGAGPLIGLWDYQDGVAGRGDAKVIPSMWFSIELQATTPVPEWDGQPVRMAQEEDVIIDAAGKIRWALKRQDQLFLVR
jgi:Xaa-Pro aminopeptidase